MSRKSIIALALLGVLLLIVLFSFLRAQHHRNDQAATVSLSNTETHQGDLYPVARVVDGDTIVVNIAGTDTRIRLIGVNTPETVDPRTPVECFGKQASDFLKAMLPVGTMVRLQSDPTQANTDKYGRLLRYVYLGDTLVDEEIIQEGYGYEYTYDLPYQFQKEFRESEEYARSGQLGLWSTTTCNGQLVPVI